MTESDKRKDVYFFLYLCCSYDLHAVLLSLLSSLPFINIDNIILSSVFFQGNKKKQFKHCKMKNESQHLS